MGNTVQPLHNTLKDLKADHYSFQRWIVEWENWQHNSSRYSKTNLNTWTEQVTAIFLWKTM